MCFLTAVIANSLEQSMCTGNFRYLTGLCSIESGQMMTLLNNEPIFPIGLYKNFNIKKFKKKEKKYHFFNVSRRLLAPASSGLAASHGGHSLRHCSLNGLTDATILEQLVAENGDVSHLGQGGRAQHVHTNDASFTEDIY